MNPHTFDVLILGGGAAGLMAAIEAGRRGRRVAVLERAERPGQKDPHLRRRPLQLHQPALAARQFPLRQSPLRQIRAGALHARRFHPPSSSATASPITRKRSASFSATARRSTLSTCSCTNAPMQACASFSPLLSPKSAATILPERSRSSPATASSRARARRRHRRPVHPENGRNRLRLRHRPPVLNSHRALPPGARFRSRSPARSTRIRRPHRRLRRGRPSTCGKRSFREKMLFTHRGLSGPAILQISSYWNSRTRSARSTGRPASTCSRLCAPNARRDPAAAKAALRAHLPARLADRLVEAARARRAGPITPSMSSSAACIPVRSSPAAPKATTRRKSRPAASARRALGANHGVPHRSRPLLHRRSRRRHRPPRRIQLPVGLGVRRRRRPRSLAGSQPTISHDKEIQSRSNMLIFSHAGLPSPLQS